MGVRLTGISTPVGGVSWEYTKGAERSAPLVYSHETPPTGVLIPVNLTPITLLLNESIICS